MAASNLPVELQDMVMEQYVASNYPVAHIIRSSKEFDDLVAEIETKAKSSHLGKFLKKSIETALYSTAVFRLNMAYQKTTTADGESKITTQIPAAVASIVDRIQNLEITFSTQIVQGRVVNATALGRAAFAMTSLKACFPRLKCFSIYLAVDVSSTRDDKAKAGQWAHVASHSGSDPLMTHFPSPLSQFQDTIAALLRAARFQGPGDTKLFKLSVERPRAEFEELGEGMGFDPNYEWHSEQWMPWVRRCDGVEFQSVDDFSGVLQKAMDCSTEQRGTFDQVL
jgi:hypothetical protein